MAGKLNDHSNYKMKILSFLPLACFADEVVDYSGYKVNDYLINRIRLNSEKFQNFLFKRKSSNSGKSRKSYFEYQRCFVKISEFVLVIFPQKLQFGLTIENFENNRYLTSIKWMYNAEPLIIEMHSGNSGRMDWSCFIPRCRKDFGSS